MTVGSLSEDLFLRITRLPEPQTNEGVVNGTIPVASFPVDEENFEVTARMTDDSKLGSSTALAFAFGCGDQPDWVKGTIGSIRAAREQFSGNRPAVVVVEVPVTKIGEDRLERLITDVDAVLRGTKTIGAIIFVVETFDVNGERTRHRMICRNSSATHQVPMSIDFGTISRSLV